MGPNLPDRGPNTAQNAVVHTRGLVHRRWACARPRSNWSAASWPSDAHVPKSASTASVATSSRLTLPPGRHLRPARLGRARTPGPAPPFPGAATRIAGCSRTGSSPACASFMRRNPFPPRASSSSSLGSRTESYASDAQPTLANGMRMLVMRSNPARLNVLVASNSDANGVVEFIRTSGTSCTTGSIGDSDTIRTSHEARALSMSPA